MEDIPVYEQLIRDKAVFFAKGSFDDIIRTSIPDKGWDKSKNYIIAVIPTEEPTNRVTKDI